MSLAAEKTGFQVDFTTREGIRERGPLDLLWKLIESYQVDIFEVSLKRITDDFLYHMSKSDLDLEQEAEFVVMAARLIYYKSRLLLPDPGFEEDFDSDALPVELVDQLLEYKRFQQAAVNLREMELQAHMMVTRESIWEQFEEGESLVNLDMPSFLKAFREFLENQEKLKPMQIEEESFTIEELMEEILAALEEKEELSFFLYIRSCSVLRCIGNFLATLELTKHKFTVLEQPAMFQDILIRKRMENGTA